MTAVASARRGLIAVVIALLAGLGLAACGSEEEPASAITIAQSAQPDSLDPAVAFEVDALEPIWLVYTPLLTYRRAEGTEGAELIAGLASDLPEISADGRTYTLTLREGLELLRRQRGAGVGLRARDRARAQPALARGAVLRGDRRRARLHARPRPERATSAGSRPTTRPARSRSASTRPDATFSNALALVFAAPVPARTPFRDLTADPPPGVGPYEITASEPGREFVLAAHPELPGPRHPRHPDGEHRPDHDADRPERARAGAAGARRPARLHAGRAAAVDARAAIRAEAQDRFTEHPTASTYYFFLNQDLRPFDDPLVREAVNRAIDRRALAYLYGGSVQPGCTLLAPGVPGYDEDLDTKRCPYAAPGQIPDLRRARALIRQAGAAGERVTVWGSRAADSRPATELYARTLDKIGLDARTRLVDPSRYYATIGDRRTRAQTGFDTWFADFPHPLDFFLVVDGDSIQATHNPNPGNVDDPFIDSEIDRLRGVDDLDSVTDDWRRLDEYVISPPQSYLVVFGHAQVATFLSQRMDPGERGLPPALPQRLLELAPRTGRLTRGAAYTAKVRRR